jgi:hypothetical protein
MPSIGELNLMRSNLKVNSSKLRITTVSSINW